MIFKLLVVIPVIMLESVAFAAQEKIIDSSLSSGKILDFIENERNYIKGKHKVNVTKKFIKESNIIAKRFGTKKTVLNLNGLSFGGEDLSNSTFSLASMMKTSLEEANLTGSEFMGVDFTGANLVNADFSGADLSNAKFEAVSLKGAKFKGANLFKAQFVKVKDLSKPELAALKKRTNSYIVLEREELPGYID